MHETLFYTCLVCKKSFEQLEYFAYNLDNHIGVLDSLTWAFKGSKDIVTLCMLSENRPRPAPQKTCYSAYTKDRQEVIIQYISTVEACYNQLHKG